MKPIAAKKGPDIQLIEFSDYVVPNAALDAGEFQANSFQNQPYLDNQKADRDYKIESVGLTVNFPIGVYSKKHKSWSDIPDGGTVSIPNNPTNGGRREDPKGPYVNLIAVGAANKDKPWAVSLIRTTVMSAPREKGDLGPSEGRLFNRMPFVHAWGAIA